MPNPTDLAKLLLILFLLSLAIRVLSALPQHHPHNMDEAYHTVNAITLANGGGFAEDFIWNYLNPPPSGSVTHPGSLYWMPLTSIIAAAGMMLGGVSYSAGQWGFILLSALLPPLGFVIAWQVSQNKRHAWVVTLLMIFSGFYFPVWTVIDTFTPFALAGALSLYAAWRMLGDNAQAELLSGGPKRGLLSAWSFSRWALLAGVMVGLAHLTRADGVLLLATIGLVIILRITNYELRITNKTTHTAALNKVEKTHYALRTTFLLLTIVILAYLLTMLPWFIRNVQVVGWPLPPGGSKTMWLQNYNDIFSYGKDLSWQSYLTWGWSDIIRSKWWAAKLNLQTLVAVQGLIVASPFAAAGWWKLRRHLLFQIAFLYTLFLFAAMTLVFTFPGPRGALFHSGGAILPFLFTASMVGLDAAIDWVARRRPSWRVGPAQVIFSGAMVFFALVISLFVYARRINASPNPAQITRAQIVQRLAGQQAIVMLGNPPDYLYRGGYKAIMIPTEDIDITLQVADRYGATYLALDSNFIEHPLSPYLSDQAAHPRLILEAIFSGPTYLYRIVDNK